MTDQEAIQKLKDFGHGFVMLGLEDGVIGASIQALEKQVKRKPVEIRSRRNFRGDVVLQIGCCPGCDSELDSTYHYCKSCGCRLDWSVEE